MVQQAHNVQRAALTVRQGTRYSESWREYWWNVRARKNASDEITKAKLSAEDAKMWQNDADADLGSSTDCYVRACQKMKRLHDDLTAKYAALDKDPEVQRCLTEINNLGKAKWHLGPSPRAVQATKRMEIDEEYLVKLGVK